MSLKELREEAGLSQHELGVRLAKKMPPASGDPGYYQPRISSYETGRNTMPLNVAVTITGILNKALKRAKSDKVATVEALLYKAPRKEKPRR